MWSVPALVVTTSSRWGRRERTSRRWGAAGDDHGAGGGGGVWRGSGGWEGLPGFEEIEPLDSGTPLHQSTTQQHSTPQYVQICMVRSGAGGDDKLEVREEREDVGAVRGATGDDHGAGF
ncbi:uncharacterized protein A4U43_C01F5140 [Asparagus officinalis]|uniref:Uncharacterized protein n=1 Tax=Asparagus officinalis TaxID=4686 RepID=A0A5P1FPG2_ASPOF|nr:uncharacterized protein A4U43_C01F5140 [Asparagus officinalis]